VCVCVCARARACVSDSCGDVRIKDVPSPHLTPPVPFSNYRISGNKGAISITCTIGDCWVSFLTGHLNAHTEELERRITDMESIMFGLHTFEGEFADSDEYVSSETIGAQYEQYVKNIEVANRSHVVITFGDFNFRLEPLGDDGQPLEHDAQVSQHCPLMVGGVGEVVATLGVCVGWARTAECAGGFERKSSKTRARERTNCSLTLRPTFIRSVLP
jgi:hypothetical protein